MSDKKAILEQELQALLQENEVLAEELDKSVVAEENERQKEEVKTSNMEAMAKGALKGFTFGLDDEMMAATQALGDVVEESDKVFEEGLVKGLDKSLSIFSENRRKYEQEYREAQRKLEEKHPISFGLGDIVGSAVGYGLGPSPIGAAQTLSKLAVTGFMHGAGRSDAETLGGSIEAGMEGAQMSAVTGVIGEAVGPVIGKAAKKAEEWGANRFVTFLRGASSSTKLSKMSIQDKLKEQKIFDWADEVLNYTRKDGKKVLSPLQTAESALESTRVAMKEAGQDIGSILAEVDEVIDINVPALYSKLKRKLVDPILSKKQVSPKQRQNAQKLNKYLEDLFYMDDLTQSPIVTKTGQKIYPKVQQVSTIQSLQQVKTELFDEIVEETANKSYTYANSLKKLANELHNTIDDKAKSKLSDEIYSKFRSSSDKYRNLTKLNDALEIRAKSSDSMNYATQLFLKATAYSSVAAMAANATFDIDPKISAGVITGLTVLAKHPQTNLLAAKGLAKLANGLKAKPDAYANISSRIMQAATMSSEAFHEEVMNAAAYVDLSEEPLGRTMDDLLLRKDSVLTTLNSTDPQMAEKLDKAIKNKNEQEIGLIIGGSIGATSQMAPGIGFNGKAFTAKDKQQVASWIKQNVPNSRQRMKMEKKFNSDFVIPTAMTDPKEAEKLQQPFMTQEYTRARDKVRNKRY